MSTAVPVLSGTSGGAGTAERIAERLGFAEHSYEHRWLVELEQLGPPPLDLAPDHLDAEVAAARLELLGVPEQDAADVLATLPEADGDEWWCIEREVYRIAATMGDPDAYRGIWPSFEGPRHPLVLRCHQVHVALATMPFTLAYFAELGVPAGIALASLADVARHMAIHRRMYGCTGIEAAWWTTLCLRAEIVDLGRLQFNRFSLQVGDESPPWYDDAEAGSRGPGFRPGDPCLGIHIPDGAPLEPERVEESFEMAERFFEKHYPAEQRRVATCLSWLLDDQLAGYLPTSSNIVQFQRRFTLLPGTHPGDDNVLQFVFRADPERPIDSLPQRTTLERAAIAHLRAGRHWRLRVGWLDLPAASS